MTKKSHQKFWRTKWNILSGKGVRKNFPLTFWNTFFRNRGGMLHRLRGMDAPASACKLRHSVNWLNRFYCDRERLLFYYGIENAKNADMFYDNPYRTWVMTVPLSGCQTVFTEICINMSTFCVLSRAGHSFPLVLMNDRAYAYRFEEHSILILDHTLVVANW